MSGVAAATALRGYPPRRARAPPKLSTRMDQSESERCELLSEHRGCPPSHRALRTFRSRQWRGQTHIVHKLHLLGHRQTRVRGGPLSRPPDGPPDQTVATDHRDQEGAVGTLMRAKPQAGHLQDAEYAASDGESLSGGTRPEASSSCSTARAFSGAIPITAIASVASAAPRFVLRCWRLASPEHQHSRPT
jgi:hypothetical protein